MERAAAAPDNQIEVLIADDDPIFRALASSKLQDLGCVVRQAADGSEAWRTVRNAKLSLAVVDLDMPGIDGLSLIHCLRGYPATQHIAIVVCTSREDRASMADALNAGATTFFSKPVNWQAFEKHIAHLLEITGLRAAG